MENRLKLIRWKRGKETKEKQNKEKEREREKHARKKKNNVDRRTNKTDREREREREKNNLVGKSMLYKNMEQVVTQENPKIPAGVLMAIPMLCTFKRFPK